MNKRELVADPDNPFKGGVGVWGGEWGVNIISGRRLPTSSNGTLGRFATASDS